MEMYCFHFIFSNADVNVSKSKIYGDTGILVGDELLRLIPSFLERRQYFSLQWNWEETNVKLIYDFMRYISPVSARNALGS